MYSTKNGSCKLRHVVFWNGNLFKVSFQCIFIVAYCNVIYYVLIYGAVRVYSFISYVTTITSTFIQYLRINKWNLVMAYSIVGFIIFQEFYGAAKNSFVKYFYFLELIISQQWNVRFIYATSQTINVNPSWSYSCYSYNSDLLESNRCRWASFEFAQIPIVHKHSSALLIFFSNVSHRRYHCIEKIHVLYTLG